MEHTHPFPGNRLRAVDFEDGNYDADAEPVDDLEEANLVTSEVVPDGGELPWLTTRFRHRPVIDIDHKVWVVPSTTPGHNHLYIDVEMSEAKLMRLLDVMAEVGIVEPGYAAASRAKGFASVRLPWIRKGEPQRRAV
jgi:hypothetical protein